MKRTDLGGMYIHEGSIAYKVLKWMQSVEDTRELKHTTAHIMASKVVQLDGVENGELSIEQMIGRMVKCNVIYRDRHEHSMYSDFRINYWNKDIPAEILAAAPVEVKRVMAKTIDSMKPNQYMDNEGCVVTPNSVPIVKQETEDPFNEDGSEPLLNDMEPSVKASVEKPEEKDSEVETQQVAVPLEIKKNGKTMSITINLTINL